MEMSDCYTTLRSIGVSVETADAIAPILLGLSEKKREAFYLWAQGVTFRKIEELCGVGRMTTVRMIRYLRDKCL